MPADTRRDNVQEAPPTHYKILFEKWKKLLTSKWESPQIIETVKWFSTMLYDNINTDEESEEPEKEAEEDLEELECMRAFENSNYDFGTEEV